MSDVTGWEKVDDERCRQTTGILEFVGRRWNSGIMLALGRGASRFSEVEALVDGISARMLAARLKELEQHGLVDRVVEPTTPVSVRYHLTSRGRELLAALQPIARYGERWERAVIAGGVPDGPTEVPGSGVDRGSERVR